MGKWPPAAVHRAITPIDKTLQETPVHWPETVETRRKQKETVRAQLLIRKKYEQ
jgi:hypothetical protein